MLTLWITPRRGAFLSLVCFDEQKGIVYDLRGRHDAIRSVRVGSITVNLHNVGYTEVVDTVNDNDEKVKALWVYFVGGRNVLLYSGDPAICQGLSVYIDACMGQFLDLTHMTQPKSDVGGKQ